MVHELLYNDAGKLYIRKSMLETYKFCPMKFKKEYLLGHNNSANYQMIVGTRFHEFAEWFFDIYSGIEPDRWEELVPSAFLPEEQEWAAWFIQEEYKRYNKNPEVFMPLMREMKIIDDDLCLSGTFDRVDKLDTQDTLAIVEYKTGKSYNEESIMRQLAFYKLLWDNNVKRGNMLYMRYINPRIQKYETIKFKSNAVDKVLLDIAGMRKCLREDTFMYQCSPVKHIICHQCDMDECKLYDYDERS
ncbi:MAG: PD-(D/E)XK nuclease family protein [Candidatus Paceibacterota bacterium]